MSAGAVLLAYLAITYGAAVQSLAAGDAAWWLYSGDASTARDLLSGLLSGLITMTSLVVSVTIVILTTAASQLGPRLITYFMGDRQIQFVLGLFIATTLYVVIVLRTLDDKLGAEGIPQAAVTVASALTIACLFALLFYVHKIARSVIADNLVEEVWSALRKDIRSIAHDEAGEEGAPFFPDEKSCVPVSLARSGYIQLIDYGQLVRLGRERGLLLRLNVRAGHFVLASNAQVDVWNAKVDDDLADTIRAAFVVGSERTPAQDIEHGLRQLVEIGLRSLSPGINDPFTAGAVIDRLGAALEQIFAHPPPPRFLADAGAVRVIADRSDFRGIVGAAFNQLRQSAAGHPAILIAMAQTFGRLAPACRTMEAKQALREQILRLEQTARGQDFSPCDAADVDGAILEARAALASQPLGGAPA